MSVTFSLDDWACTWVDEFLANLCRRDHHVLLCIHISSAIGDIVRGQLADAVCDLCSFNCCHLFHG